jgi:hypothetical protein
MKKIVMPALLISSSLAMLLILALSFSGNVVAIGPPPKIQ